jgi:hypothetical protein
MLLMRPEYRNNIESTLDSKNYDMLCSKIAQAILFGNPDQESGSIAQSAVDYVLEKFGLDFSTKYGPSVHEARQQVIRSMPWYTHHELAIDALELDKANWRSIHDSYLTLVEEPKRAKALDYLCDIRKYQFEEVKFTFHNDFKDRDYELTTKSYSIGIKDTIFVQAICLVHGCDQDPTTIYNEFKKNSRIMDLCQREMTNIYNEIEQIKRDMLFVHTEWPGYSQWPLRGGNITMGDSQDSMLEVLTRAIKKRQDLPQLVSLLA